MQFRLDFFFRIIMDCVFYSMHFVFFSVLTSHAPQLGGWDSFQLQVLATSICLVDAIQMTLFSNNMHFFSTQIVKGGLDFHLVRPVSPRFMMSLKSFAFNSFVNLLIAIGICISILSRSPYPIQAISIVWYALSIMMGAFIYYNFQFAIRSLVFWTHSGNALNGLTYTLDKLGEKPHTVYPKWFQKFFTTLLPYALVASVPSQILVTDSPFLLLLSMVGGSLFTFGISQWIWVTGLDRYQSASS
jgi:ABC-2 type transport system permease protein